MQAIITSVVEIKMVAFELRLIIYFASLSKIQLKYVFGACLRRRIIIAPEPFYSVEIYLPFQFWRFFNFLRCHLPDKISKQNKILLERQRSNFTQSR